jgi:pantetheine-phosphate adenylyltransferase
LSAENPRVAICPGSYDPVTNGHLDIITRSSRVFDRVIVGVVNEPIRKQKTLFTPDERRRFLEDATSDLANVEIEIFSNLLVDFAKDKGATAIVKGLRAISDFEYEFEMNQLNRKLAPEIESMYIFASAHYSFLSSTGVKEMATFGGDVSDLVPDGVAEALKERIQR